jgi:hypothetical protein
LAGSLFVLTQVVDDEQNVGVAAGHVHALPEQALCGAEQACAHIPQFIGSDDVSMQVPLQFLSLPGQDC